MEKDKKDGWLEWIEKQYMKKEVVAGWIKKYEKNMDGWKDKKK